MKDENPEARFPVSLCPTICEIRCLPAVAGNPRLADLSHQRHELAAAGDFEFVENRV